MVSSHNIVTTVSGSFVTLAFRIRDNFDDLVIKDEKFNFYLNGDIITPIKKYDGYYIITDIQDKNFNLKIVSHRYFDKILDINLDNINEKNKCIEIFLIPNYKYFIPNNSCQIKGNVDPNTLILLTKYHSRTNLRYQSFNKTSNTIFISNPAGESLNGRVLAIVDCENNKFEVVFIKEKISDTEYLVDVKISNKIKRSLPMHKAYVSQSDENGMFNLYIKENDFPDEEYIISFYKNGKLINKTFNLECVGHIDLQKDILKESGK